MMKYQNAKQSADIPPTPPTTPPTMALVSGGAVVGSAAGAGPAADVAVAVDDTTMVEGEEVNTVRLAVIKDCISFAVDAGESTSWAAMTLPCWMAYPLPPAQQARLSCDPVDPQHKLPSAQVVMAQEKSANRFPLESLRRC